LYVFAVAVVVVSVVETVSFSFGKNGNQGTVGSRPKINIT
jgi:hypothetical protein